MKGDIPDEEKITIRLSLEKSESFQVNFRLPYWSKHTIIKINGAGQKPEINGGWTSLPRNWTDGDIITLEFDFGLRIEWFDPTVFSESDPMVAWHIAQWAVMGIMVTDENTGAHKDQPNVKVEDALPHRKAAVLFRGPLALARDIRLGDPDVLGPVPDMSLFEQSCDIVPLTAPSGIIKAYEAKLPTGETIRLCDFASAGNTWDENSMFSAWVFEV
jgi:hypothetical protein